MRGFQLIPKILTASISVEAFFTIEKLVLWYTFYLRKGGVNKLIEPYPKHYFNHVLKFYLCCVIDNNLLKMVFLCTYEEHFLKINRLSIVQAAPETGTHGGCFSLERQTPLSRPLFAHHLQNPVIISIGFLF